MPLETYIAIVVSILTFGGYALLLGWASWYAGKPQAVVRPRP
jgi:hypothetical protein